MLKILILDDNNDKTTKISRVLKKIDGISENSIELAQDIASGKKKVKEKKYDLLVLDMQLPSRYDQPPLRDGGVQFLKEIRTNERRYNIPKEIISITEYEDIFKDINKELKEITHLHYNNTSEWEEILKSKIRLLNDKKNGLNKIDYEYDLAIICALKTPELDQLLNLVAEPKLSLEEGDSSFYYKFNLKNKDRDLKCIVTYSEKMGQVHSASLAMKVINKFRPKYLGMCGILGGVKEKVKMGDIIVGETIWNYDSGKYIDNQFQQDPHQMQLDSELRFKVELLKKDQSKIDLISDEWQGNNPDTRLKLHIGAIGCGSAVIASLEKQNEIKKQNRKVLGFEMESYGVAVACHVSTIPSPKFISIKSVCDFGDSKKSDDYQKYAAYTSAKTLIKLFENYVEFES